MVRWDLVEGLGRGDGGLGTGDWGLGTGDSANPRDASLFESDIPGVFPSPLVPSP